METIYLERTTELRKNLKSLQKELKVRIALRGKQAIISGDSLDEYEASIILDAIGFGFSAQKALQLKDPDITFKKVHIKDFTRRKNLKEVIARVIGSKGQTKRVLEDISDCDIIIREHDIGIIGDAEGIESTTTAITNIIKGTKQSNAYHYLEKMNRAKKQKTT
ncbi:hypothetical protein CMI47_16320 [Candidatus Pacearchaeota archaeon]|nr:hypothetical protein [Candidatus Pacearchaeota archaeon]|tara:strand:+ start:902 stop:1393 length:492 start_codon:yes stop_codon:yes gene_type:complete